MSSQKTHLSTTGKWIWHADGAEEQPDEDFMVNRVLESELSDEDLAADIKKDADEER